MILAARDAFWFAGTGNKNNQKGSHLFLCLAVALINGLRSYLVIPVCSVTPKSDITCPLSVNDHSDLTHSSYAAYYMMRILSQGVLDTADFGNRITPSKPFKQDVFDRICFGITVSPDTVPVHAKFYATHA